MKKVLVACAIAALSAAAIGAQAADVRSGNWSGGRGNWSGAHGNWSGAHNWRGGNWSGGHDWRGGNWSGGHNWRGGNWSGGHNWRGGNWSGGHNWRGTDWHGGHGWRGGHSHRHHGHGSRFHGSVFLGAWPWYWWGPSYYGYPAYAYYDYPTEVYVERVGPSEPVAPQVQFYCPDTGYYPSVQTCPRGWLRVVPDSGGPR